MWPKLRQDQTLLIYINNTAAQQHKTIINLLYSTKLNAGLKLKGSFPRNITYLNKQNKIN